jgi:hypothetical protein
LKTKRLQLREIGKRLRAALPAALHRDLGLLLREAIPAAKRRPCRLCKRPYVIGEGKDGTCGRAECRRQYIREYMRGYRQKQNGPPSD